MLVSSENNSGNMVRLRGLDWDMRLANESRFYFMLNNMDKMRRSPYFQMNFTIIFVSVDLYYSEMSLGFQIRGGGANSNLVGIICPPTPRLE